MKHFITAIAISALATISFAQFGQNDNRRQDRGDRDQNSRRDNFGNYREAIAEINQGQRSLTSALPVYRGRRNTATDLSERAERELRVGMTNERPSWRDDRNDVRDNISLDRYSKEQVRLSNEKLRDASESFGNALRLLNRPGWDGKGNKRDAMNDLRKAIDEIKKAIESTRDFMSRGRDWDRDHNRDRDERRGRDKRTGRRG